jgi:low temperature requirement protein LtrA
MNQSESEEVSPLELFFDLVFVFALSQLSHYLLDRAQSHSRCRRTPLWRW